MARGQQTKGGGSVQEARENLIIQLEGELTEKEVMLDTLRAEIPNLKKKITFLKNWSKEDEPSTGEEEPKSE